MADEKTPSQLAYEASLEPESCCPMEAEARAKFERLRIAVRTSHDEENFDRIERKEAEAVIDELCYGGYPFTSSPIDTSNTASSAVRAETVAEAALAVFEFVGNFVKDIPAEKAPQLDAFFAALQAYKSPVVYANAITREQFRAFLKAHRITYECKDGRHCGACGMSMSDIAHMRAEHCPNHNVTAVPKHDDRTAAVTDTRAERALVRARLEREDAVRELAKARAELKQASALESDLRALAAEWDDEAKHADWPFSDLTETHADSLRDTVDGCHCGGALCHPRSSKPRCTCACSMCQRAKPLPRGTL